MVVCCAGGTLSGLDCTHQAVMHLSQSLQSCYIEKGMISSEFGIRELGEIPENTTK